MLESINNTQGTAAPLEPAVHAAAMHHQLAQNGLVDWVDLTSAAVARE